MAASRKYFDGTLKSVDSASRRIVGLAYPPQLDRDGETIKPSAFTERGLESFRKKPSLLWAHDYKGLPIGVVTEIRATTNGPEFEAQFFDHELASKVWKIYEDCGAAGIPVPLGVSIGFMPLNWSDERVFPNQRGRTYTEVELLEISVVPVPSNSGALAQARSKGVDMTVVDSTIKAISERTRARLIGIEAILQSIVSGGIDEGAFAREALAGMLGALYGTDDTGIWPDDYETGTMHETIAHLYYIIGDMERTADEHALEALALIARLRGNEPIAAVQSAPVTESVTEPVQQKSIIVDEQIVSTPGPNIIPAADIDTQIKALRNEALNRIEQLKLIAKEGRVLSGANRTLMTNCVSQLAEAMRAMQDLLDATDPEKSYSIVDELTRQIRAGMIENYAISNNIAALLMRGYETTTGAAVTTEPTHNHHDGGSNGNRSDRAGQR